MWVNPARAGPPEPGLTDPGCDGDRPARITTTPAGAQYTLVIGGEDEGYMVTTGILLGINVRLARPDEIEAR